MLNPTLAERIVHFRKRAGITQEQLASKVGVGPSAVTAWINGSNHPSYANIQKIAEACGVSLAEFFGEIGDDDAGAGGPDDGGERSATAQD